MTGGRGLDAAAVLARPAAGAAHLTAVADEPRREARRGQPFRRRSPATIAAVAAALASAQVAAATLTVCHGPSAGSPVRGSTMWCSTWPARRHWRQVIDEVATAPRDSRTRWGREEPAGPGPSVTTIGQPSRGGVPAVAMSPPRLTSTPPVFRHAASAARAARSDPRPLAVAPRSRRTPAGSRSSGPSSLTACQPGAGAGGPGGSRRSGSIAAKSRS